MGFVSSREAAKFCPELLIKFYQSRITWNDKEELAVKLRVWALDLKVKLLKPTNPYLITYFLLQDKDTIDPSTTNLVKDIISDIISRISEVELIQDTNNTRTINYFFLQDKDSTASSGSGSGYAADMDSDDMLPSPNSTTEEEVSDDMLLQLNDTIEEEDQTMMMMEFSAFIANYPFCDSKKMLNLEQHLK